MVECYLPVRMDHILCISSSIGGHLGHFHTFAIANNLQRMLSHKCVFEPLRSIPQGTRLERNRRVKRRKSPVFPLYSTTIVCSYRTCGVLPHHAILKQQLGVLRFSNSVLTLFTWRWPRIHRLRAQSLKAAPTSDTNCKEGEVVTCAEGWAINWRFPWTPPWVHSFAREAHIIQVNSLLISFWLSTKGTKGYKWRFPFPYILTRWRDTWGKIQKGPEYRHFCPLRVWGTAPSWHVDTFSFTAWKFSDPVIIGILHGGFIT